MCSGVGKAARLAWCGCAFADLLAHLRFTLASIDVVAAAFDGKSAVDRQRMVYKAIWQELQVRAQAAMFA